MIVDMGAVYAEMVHNFDQWYQRLGREIQRERERKKEGEREREGG